MFEFFEFVIEVLALCVDSPKAAFVLLIVLGLIVLITLYIKC
jgi:hypothetical protein